MLPQTITGTRQYDSGESRDFKTVVEAPTFYQAVRQFHQEVSDSDSTFVVNV